MMNRLLIKIGEYQGEDSEQIEEFIDLHYSGDKEKDKKLLKHLLNATNQFFNEENEEDEEDGSLSGTTEALTLAEIILQEAQGFAKKFVDKVENGQARSKETYSDMKILLKKIEEYNKNRNSF